MTKRRSQPHITPEYARAARAAANAAHSECDSRIAAALKKCRSEKTAAMRKRDAAIARIERTYREEIISADAEFGLSTRIAKRDRSAARASRIAVLERFAANGNAVEAIDAFNALIALSSN